MNILKNMDDSRHLYEFKDEYANMPKLSVQKDDRKVYMFKKKETALFQKEHSVGKFKILQGFEHGTRQAFTAPLLQQR